MLLHVTKLAAVQRMFQMVSRHCSGTRNSVHNKSSSYLPWVFLAGSSFSNAGVTARPHCALQNRATGDKFCVLICHEEGFDWKEEEVVTSSESPINLRSSTSDYDNAPIVGDAQCGEGTCQVVQAGLGICTYE